MDEMIGAFAAALQIDGGYFEPHPACQYAEMYSGAEPCHKTSSRVYLSDNDGPAYCLCSKHGRLPGCCFVESECAYDFLLEDRDGVPIKRKNLCHGDAIGKYIHPVLGKYALCEDHAPRQQR